MTASAIPLRDLSPPARPGLSADETAEVEAALAAIIIRLARRQALTDHLAAMQPGIGQP